MHSIFLGNAYSVAMIQQLSFTFFPFSAFATQLFSTPVTSLNLRNQHQAPLFTELRLLQATLNVVRASNSKRDCDAWSLLLLAAMVRSFAHMPLGISDRNNIVTYPPMVISTKVQLPQALTNLFEINVVHFEFYLRDYNHADSDNIK